MHTTTNVISSPGGFVLLRLPVSLYYVFVVFKPTEREITAVSVKVTDDQQLSATTYIKYASFSPSLSLAELHIGSSSYSATEKNQQCQLEFGGVITE